MWVKERGECKGERELGRREIFHPMLPRDSAFPTARVVTVKPVRLSARLSVWIPVCPCTHNARIPECVNS